VDITKFFNIKKDIPLKIHIFQMG